MIKSLKKVVLKNKTLRKIAITLVTPGKEKKLFNQYTKNLMARDQKRHTIFYLGIPVHNNLGDLAQGVCIKQWIKKHYPDYNLCEIETNALVHTRYSVLPQLCSAYKKGDIIIFQSGYTTTDLGGYADEMHRAVISSLPDAHILMMPQTIFFQKKENEKITSKIYNSARNMLYLARDNISYGMAQKMFPNIPIKLYPDIVTTMIGSRHYEYERKGIILCCRNDSEKFYSDEELSVLEENCRKFASVDRTDTTKSSEGKTVANNAEQYIQSEIQRYAHYKVMITDRYHGTILSLIAGTPVIIIKTTDHKVTTGADWFKGIYDEYVYVANSLEDACKHAKEMVNKPLTYRLEPYFEREYYDKLPEMFQSLGQRGAE